MAVIVKGSASVQTNADEVAATAMRLAERLNDKKVLLLAEMGMGLQKDVQERIRTADGGRWQPASKWILAKKNAARALAGAEKYVKWRIRGNRVQIYGDMPGVWKLSQHDKGFTNKAFSRAEMGEHGRIEINVVNPAPLRLSKPGVFRWVPKRVGVTPARRIWSNDQEMLKVGAPIFSRWMRNVVESTPGVR